MKTTILRLAAAAAAAAALALAPACGGDDKGGGGINKFEPPAPPTPPAPPVAVTGVQLSAGAMGLNPRKTGLLAAEVLPAGAANKAVSWSSDNEAVATVEDRGLNAAVTAVAAGRATITVETEDGGKVASCTVTVTNVPATAMKLDAASVSIAPNGVAVVTATVEPPDATDQAIVWTTSASARATVTGVGLAGMISGVAAGAATVTAALGDLSAEVAVTITAYSILSVSLDKPSLELPPDPADADTLAVFVVPTSADQTTTWAVDPPTGVVTLSGTGTRRTVTPVANGTATVTVTAADGRTVSCPVTVADLPVTVGMMKPKTYAANVQTVYAIKADGGLWVWGANTTSGKLGAGSNQNIYVASPHQISDSTLPAKSVSIGNTHGAVVLENGRLITCGSNSNGRTGLNTTTGSTISWTYVGTDSDWAAVSCGDSHTLALKADGRLYAWGLNTNGRLGDGTTTQRTTPTRIGTASNWAHIAAGYDHSVAIKNYGALYTWGNNNRGQLGQGDTTQRTSPTKVQSAGGNDWAAIASSAGWAGNYQTNWTLALKKDGSLWSWGAGTFGKLGDGTGGTDGTQQNANNFRTSPYRVGRDNDWKAVFCGSNHSMALKDDGSLWAWGDDHYGDGRLGIGPVGNQTTPARVLGGNVYAAAAGSYYHTGTVRTDGTIWSCGDSINGVFGSGRLNEDNVMTPDFEQCAESGWRVPEY